jgi:hypothetical protein
MRMRLIHAYFCRMGGALPYTLDSYFTPACPREGGGRLGGAFVEYSATVRDGLGKRLSSRMNELLADIERRTQWKMDLNDDSVEIPMSNAWLRSIGILRTRILVTLARK